MNRVGKSFIDTFSQSIYDDVIDYQNCKLKKRYNDENVSTFEFIFDNSFVYINIFHYRNVNIMENIYYRNLYGVKNKENGPCCVHLTENNWAIDGMYIA